jgi:hypothetical protein
MGFGEVTLLLECALERKRNETGDTTAELDGSMIHLLETIERIRAEKKAARHA